MEFDLTEQQRMIGEAARRVGEDFGPEYWTKQDAKHAFPREFWDAVVDFKPFAEWGAIAEKDLELIRFADTPGEAFEQLRDQLTAQLEPPSEQEASAPGIARTRG